MEKPISPDGKHVYVNPEALGVTIFSRDIATGLLTYVGRYITGTSMQSKGLAVSPDGRFVAAFQTYGQYESSILKLYERNSTTGLLRLVEERSARWYAYGQDNVIFSQNGKFIISAPEMQNVIYTYEVLP